LPADTLLFLNVSPHMFMEKKAERGGDYRLCKL